MARNTRKPRLLIIGPLPPPYIGPAVATGHLLRSHIIAEEFEILHLNTGDSDGFQGIGKLNWGNIAKAARHIWQCWKVMATKRPQVVYIPIDRALWGFLRDIKFMIPARLFGAKLLAHLRAGRFDLRHDFGVFGRVVARLGLALPTYCVVLGTTVQDVFGPYVPERKLRILANGIDLIEWDLGEREEKEEGTHRIAYIANLYRDKGQHVMLKALPAIAAEFLDVHVTFAGQWQDEAYRAECMKLVVELGISSHVSFPGSLDAAEKKQLLSSSSLVVFAPVKPEGLPWVALEAMAEARPVIGTPQGVMMEVIVHDETGYIIPPDDPQALAEAVSKLLGNPAEMTRLGNAGRKRIETVYSEAATHQRFVEIAREALQGEKR